MLQESEVERSLPHTPWVNQNNTINIKGRPMATDMYTIIPQETGEGRTDHINGWNGVNGMISNTWQPFVS
jgi:hypothetical protein